MAIEKKEVLENTVSTEPVKQVDKDEVIKKLMEKIDNLEKTTGILMGATDKRLLNNYLGKNKKKLPSHVNLRVFNGKCIVGWSLDDKGSFKNPNTGIWSESQTVELTCEDGEKIKTSLYDFEINYDLEKFLVLESRTDDDTGDRELKIKSEIDGRELNINVKFVN